MKKRLFSILLSTAMLLPMASCAAAKDGKDGVDGTNGMDGVNGAEGKSAYELAVENGFVGDLNDWLASLEGETGATGVAGDKGDKGDKGDQGIQGIQGIQGETGNGIESVELTATDGLIDTYTVTFTDGTTATFTVTNGDKGDKGDKGDQGIQGIQGIQGETGNGIESVELTATDGLIDTYTVTFTDGTITTFTVTNGEKGDKGDKGDQGIQGIQGIQGDKGDKGDKGETGDAGKSAYEMYCEIYGYEGSEEEWIADLVAGYLTEYTVTFDLNGGAAGEGFAEQITVTGGTLLDLTVPTRTGYTFLGWYTGESLNDGIVTTTTPVKEDMELIARWQINTLTVKFLDQDGKTLKIQRVDYGSAATAPAAPTVDKFLFDSWDRDFSCVTSDLTVKAQYVANTYTLSYETDGGTELADEEYYVGDIPVVPTAPSKSGYYFIGWYSDAAYTQEYSFDTALEADTTLYACFSETIPISNAEDLVAIRSNTSGKYHLTADINLDGATWTPIYFYGILDGCGYKIYNFTISKSNVQDVGFFSANYGTVQNLTLADFTFSVATDNSTTFYAGALVGNNYGTIDNCHVTDAVLGYSAEKPSTKGAEEFFGGGLVGGNWSTISNCTLSAEMEGYVYQSYWGSGSGYANLRIGGLVGYNSGTLQNSVATVDASFEADAAGGTGTSYQTTHNYAVLNFGGAVANNAGSIINCGAECDLTTTQFTSHSGSGYSVCEVYAGGFVQKNEGTVKSCYATGSISLPSSSAAEPANTWLAGFVSENLKTISNSYADVSINCPWPASSDNYIGGFVGYNDGGTITTCYAMGDIEAKFTGRVGGFAGRNETGSTIQKSFCVGNVTLKANNTNTGNFVGEAIAGSTLFKSYYNEDMVFMQNGISITPTNTDGVAETVENLQSEALLVDTLSWSTDVWSFADGEYPKLKWELEAAES